jgi:hypothetical protein
MEKHKNNMSSFLKVGQECARWLHLAVDAVIPPGTKYQPGSCVPTYKASYECDIKLGGNHTAYSLDQESKLGLDRSEQISAEQEDLCLDIGLTQENRVKYQSLPEPGKFRIITKGPGALYTGLRRFQGFLLNCWTIQNYSTFTDEMEERIKFRLGSRNESQDLLMKDGNFIISGDYDSATDALAEETTIIILKRILSNLNLTDTKIGKAALYSFLNTVVEYPDGTEIQKTRGQLMGHPLSFPLLCIANLSTYMRTMNRTTSSELNRSPFLINGDDLIFEGELKHYNSWRKYSARIGLKVNEVKTYLHKSYGLINSFFFNRKTGNAIRYAAFALSIGHNIKSDGKFSLSQSNKILQFLTASPECYHKTLKRNFFQRLKKACKKVQFKFREMFFTPNLFVPKALGGLGLPNERGSFYVTKLQAALALYLMENPGKSWLMERFSNLPRGAELGIKKFLNVRVPGVPWQIGNPKCKKFQIYGPMNREFDLDSINNDLLIKCLRSTQWKISTPKCFEDIEPLRRLVNKKEIIKKARSKRLPRKKTIMEFCSRRVPEKFITFQNDNSIEGKMKKMYGRIKKIREKSFHVRRPIIKIGNCILARFKAIL